MCTTNPTRVSNRCCHASVLCQIDFPRLKSAKSVLNLVVQNIKVFLRRCSDSFYTGCFCAKFEELRSVRPKVVHGT